MFAPNTLIGPTSHQTLLGLTILDLKSIISHSLPPNLRFATKPQISPQSKPFSPPMALPPGPYSGTSTLALVARVSAFSFGVVYGSIKLKYLQAKAKSHRKAESKAAHH